MGSGRCRAPLGWPHPLLTPPAPPSHPLVMELGVYTGTKLTRTSVGAGFGTAFRHRGGPEAPGPDVPCSGTSQAWMRVARDGPSTKLFAISPPFTQVTSWGSSEGNGSASPHGTGPASKGETLIQSDCSFGNFLPMKKQNEQKPFSSGKKTKPNMETKLRSAPGHVMGADTVPATAALTADRLFRVSAEQHRGSGGDGEAVMEREFFI